MFKLLAFTAAGPQAVSQCRPRREGQRGGEGKTSFGSTSGRVQRFKGMAPECVEKLVDGRRTPSRSCCVSFVRVSVVIVKLGSGGIVRQKLRTFPASGCAASLNLKV